MKMLSTGIRSIISIKVKTSVIFPSCQDPEDTATIFNPYFVNIGSKIDADVPRARKFPMDYLSRKLGPSFFSHSYLTQLKFQVSFLSIKVKIFASFLAYHVT